MKKIKIFWMGIIAIAMGIVFGVHANLSTYIDSEGVIHDNFSIPLSAFFIIIGVVFLIISSLIYFLRRRSIK